MADANQGRTSNPNAQQCGSTSEQQNMQRSGGAQRSDLARRGAAGAPYFPSPGEFFGNPFGVMRRMHEEMDRVFAQALGGGMMSAGESGGGGGNLTSWSPAIEVKEQGNNLVVSAELPGLKPDEVQVEVNEDSLV